MGDFNFNAPQYVDFTSSEALELNDYGEEYFDMDHEEEIEYQVQYEEEQVIEYLNGNTPEPHDPLKEDEDTNENEVDAEAGRPKLRRSVSAGQIVFSKPQVLACDLSPALEALQLSDKKPTKLRHGPTQNILPSKTNISSSKSVSGSATKLNKPLNQRPRAISRDAIHKIGQPKNEQLKRKMSVENLQPNKYISLAEAINKFQFGTPQRFHTKSSKIQFNNHKTTALVHTIPQSPMLSTKQRSRQPTCVSQQEKDKKEAEEMKKHQIKANAVNYKIFQAPVLKVEKKASTVPQPFKFAEVQFHKPVEAPKIEVYEFHARPAPKTTATAAKPTPRRSAMPSTTAITPNVLRRQRETLPKFQESQKTHTESIRSVEIQHDGVTKKIIKSKAPVRTKMEPFSFEDRNKLIQQRKEQKIKKFLEEEKKAREFHARPIPSKIAGGCGQVESKVGKFLHYGSNSSLSSSKNDENSEPKVSFKAKPATVIHKKPFLPKKEDRPLLEITEFSLNTDKRAKDREEFEKKIKEKEEEYEKMKVEQAERQKLTELEEVNRIRKETVHKANPIKHYKAIDIHPSTKKITSPISPMITKRRQSRMEN